jgi:polyisoprenoid-binding protein YceI
MLRPLVAAVALTLGVGFVAAQNTAPATASAAVGTTYTVDPVHTMVLFRISHVGASQLWGRFNTASGTFTRDDASGNPLAIDIQVKADSIDTANTGRDNHLRSPDFFNVKEHPTISFKSTSSKMISSDKVQVNGDLTLHGVTKPITVEVETYGPIDHPKMGRRAGFETVFTIKRADYGMGFMAAPDETVRITVAVEGVVKQ